MLTQTVTAKGQVTLRREVLQHLGIASGDRIAIEKAPGGEVHIRAVKAAGRMTSFLGCLEDVTDVYLTVEQMNDAIAAGWAGAR